jgi:cyclohexanecarboxylate-CoA ligase
MDSEGYLTIAGRSKDLVIRGGENVPVFEVEALLMEHPKVKTAVVVGVPDARLGERVCAVVELRQPEDALKFQEMAQFLT